MNEFEKKLIRELQFNFPYSLKPFRDIAENLGVSEETVIKTIKKLKKRK